MKKLLFLTITAVMAIVCFVSVSAQTNEQLAAQIQAVIAAQQKTDSKVNMLNTKITKVQLTTQTETKKMGIQMEATVAELNDSVQSAKEFAAGLGNKADISSQTNSAQIKAMTAAIENKADKGYVWAWGFTPAAIAILLIGGVGGFGVWRMKKMRYEIALIARREKKERENHYAAAQQSLMRPIKEETSPHVAASALTVDATEEKIPPSLAVVATEETTNIPSALVAVIQPKKEGMHEEKVPLPLEVVETDLTKRPPGAFKNRDGVWVSKTTLPEAEERSEQKKYNVPA